MQQQFRQGDVLLERVSSLPTKVTPVARDERGRLVLMLGEATGHAHAILEPNAVLYQAADVAERYLEVRESAELVDSWKVRSRQGEGYVPAYQDRARVIAAGFTILGRESVPGVIKRHEEHLHITILPGVYVQRPQFEYNEGEERRGSD